MLRKSVSLLIILVLIFALCLSTYAVTSDATNTTTKPAVTQTAAAPTYRSLLKDKPKENTAEFLVEILSPGDTNVSTNKSTFGLSGTTAKPDVKVILEKVNVDTKKYELFENTEEVSSWEIGKFGVFAKEINLDKGINKIRIIAYRTSLENNLKYEDIQVSYFNITWLSDSIIKRIVDFIKDGITFPKK